MGRTSRRTRGRPISRTAAPLRSLAAIAFSIGSPGVLLAGGAVTGAALHHLNTSVPVEIGNRAICADVDGDGRVDVISAGALHVLLAGEVEDFTESFTDGTRSYFWVAAGDFTGDAALDILATYLDPTGDQGTLFVGDGTGSFAPGLPPEPMPRIQYAIDVNGDGLADSVGVEDQLTLEIRLSLGGGLFAPPVQSTVPIGAGWELAGRFGDLDGDGFADLAQSHDGTITIYHGSATGEFTAGIAITGGDSGNHDDTALIDLDGDGLLDLVYMNLNGVFDQLVIRHGTGGGTLAPPIFGSFDDHGLMRMEIADLGGDGIPEIVIIGNAVNVFTRLPAGTYAIVQRVAVGSALQRSWLADVHGDGVADLIALRYGGFQVIPGRDGRLSLPEVRDPAEFASQLSSTDFQLVDLEGDGEPEFLYGQRFFGPTELRFFEFQDGAFSAIGAPIAEMSAVLGRFGADPWLDLVSSSVDVDAQELVLEVRPGDGAGNFVSGTTTTFTLGQIASPTQVSDLNGDGIDDLWTAIHQPGGISEIRVLLCDPAGALVLLPPFVKPGTVSGVADIDGNGTLDFYGPVDDEVSVLLGDGTGAWTVVVPVPVTLLGTVSTPLPVLAADYDGDGDGDFLVTQHSTGSSVGTHRWLRNDGAMTFTEQSDLVIPYGRPEKVVDLDSDGDLDVAVRFGDHFQFVTMEANQWSAVELGSLGIAVDALYADLDADGFVDLVGAGLEGLVVALSGADCDIDGLRDRVQVVSGLVPDCNGNLRPDGCDLADGTSVDIDADGLLDDCFHDFVRGDFDQSGEVDIADAIGLLRYLMGQQVTIPSCLAALDLNLDRLVDIADAVSVIQAAIGTGTPPQPFPACGPGSADELECDHYVCP